MRPVVEPERERRRDRSHRCEVVGLAEVGGEMTGEFSSQTLLPPHKTGGTTCPDCRDTRRDTHFWSFPGRIVLEERPEAVKKFCSDIRL